MKQTLHIFLKDLRHLWIEIVFLLAVVAGFAWIYPKRWVAPGHAVNPSSEWALLAGFLKLFIVIGWWLLIARSIQDESLVGDRQFWITRPYERKYLLAAKGLFILCFVYVPIFLAQCSIMAQAGFNPGAHLPSLLYDLMLLTVVFILPATAIATVTSNLARLTLTILGVCLGLVAFVSLALALSSRGVLESSVPTNDFLSIPTLLCVFVMVVGVQFVARRSALSRTMLLALPLVLLLYAGIFSSSAVVNHTYPAPAPSEPAPFSISVRQDAPKTESLSAVLTKNGKKVEVFIPIKISSGAEDVVWIVSGVNVWIQSQGVDWRSGWQGMNMGYYRSGHNGGVRFAMSRAIFDRIQTMPATLHLTLALLQARRASVWSVPVYEQDFTVPGFGICTPNIIFPDSAPQIAQISCRYPLRQPTLTLVQAAWSQSPCPTAGTEASGWTGNAPGEFGISPVDENPVWFSQIYETGLKGPTATPHICPGTPITFTLYKYIGRQQWEFTLQNFSFPSSKPERTGAASGSGVFVFAQ